MGEIKDEWLSAEEYSADEFWELLTQQDISIYRENDEVKTNWKEEGF